jgi:hypothetical protein
MHGETVKFTHSIWYMSSLLAATASLKEYINDARFYERQIKVAGCGTKTALRSTTTLLRSSAAISINSSLTDTSSYIFVIEGSLFRVR